ncbi:MAG TPA: type II CAAX endopeptidase family protein [Capillibacterium sp.]
MEQRTISIGTVFTWLVAYLFVCGIIPITLDKLLWETIRREGAPWLNLLTLLLCNLLFLLGLKAKYRLQLDLFSNLSINGVFLALACSILFFLALDNFLDPLLDRLFLASAEEYRRAIEQLRQDPVVSFIRVCLLAPVVEEILIRGWVLDSLRENYGIMLALFLSTLFFAALHFNFVQTLSAVIPGLILGLLYLKTGSLFCCILAHSLYNAISYLTIILNLPIGIRPG